MLTMMTMVCYATEQYNLDRMDAEEGGIEDESDDAEINSNLPINLPPRDQQQQQFITADFFRQAMLAAMAQNTASSIAGPVPARPVVTEVSV